MCVRKMTLGRSRIDWEKEQKLYRDKSESGVSRSDSDLLFFEASESEGR